MNVNTAEPRTHSRAASGHADERFWPESSRTGILADPPLTVGGTIRDSHGSTDPEVWLIARTITCPDGKVRMDLTPEMPEGLNQTGSWKIVSGTGDFDGLSGSGEMEVVYDPNPDEPAGETYTGTVTR